MTERDDRVKSNAVSLRLAPLLITTYDGEFDSPCCDLVTFPDATNLFGGTFLWAHLIYNG